MKFNTLSKALLLSSVLVFTGCGGGGSGSNAGGTIPPSPPPPSPPPPSPPPPPPPPPGGAEPAFATEKSTSRFLSQATFGASPGEIQALAGTDASDWLIAEFNKPATTNINFVVNFTNQNRDAQGYVTFDGKQGPSHSFWINAITGNDQLRQRMAYALSQILVVSHNENNSEIFDYPNMVGYYQDRMVENAFGNYRTLLEDVTYSPAMGFYLTYWQNEKGEPSSGRVPDENYAREVMQLFTIGLLELNIDGTPKTDAAGNTIETYTNDDITGIAKVFTGLSLDDPGFFTGVHRVNPVAHYSPMKMFPNHHSPLEKKFLGTTIPANTDGVTSIDTALDTLFNHPNMGPFIGRQLIQRFTVSNPSPAYVQRVATAFNNGTYALPNGTSVGTGNRGDLKATIAAVLMDKEARNETTANGDQFGKVREPVLRFIQWARAFNVGTITPQNTPLTWYTGGPDALAQHPYKASSVFNFYRPGYVAPGTKTGAAGLTMPEMQLVSANTTTGYANFMSYFIFAAARDAGPPEDTSFIPDYTPELALADNPQALVDHLDLLLTGNSMSSETKNGIVTTVQGFPLSDPNDPTYDGPFTRVTMAILMVMTSPDYLVQR